MSLLFRMHGYVFEEEEVLVVAMDGSGMFWNDLVVDDAFFFFGALGGRGNGLKERPTPFIGSDGDGGRCVGGGWACLWTFEKHLSLSLSLSLYCNLHRRVFFFLSFFLLPFFFLLLFAPNMAVVPFGYGYGYPGYYGGGYGYGYGYPSYGGYGYGGYGVPFFSFVVVLFVIVFLGWTFFSFFYLAGYPAYLSRGDRRALRRASRVLI